MDGQKAEGRTEAKPFAPGLGGLSPQLEGILGRVRPYRVWVEHKLRQEIQYRVGGYRVFARPGGLEIRDHGFVRKLEIIVPGLEMMPDFHYTDKPEPNLYDVLDYWAGIARFLQHLAEDMADQLKEGPKVSG